MRVLSSGLCFCWGILVVGSVARPSACTAQDNLLPWQGEFFQAKPADVLAAVDALQPLEAGVLEYLLWDERTQIQADHRKRVTTRRVYRIQSREDIENRGTFSTHWSPWLESQPQIRARVITPAGKVHELNPATVTETAAQNVGDQMFLDNRVLSAPLPAVEVGSIIETEKIVQQTTPFCDQGVVGKVFWQPLANVRKTYFEVRAAKSLSLRMFSLGESAPTEIKTDGDDKIWQWQRDSVIGLKSLWAFLPPDVPMLSHVVYSTGDSWNDIAKHYHQMVQKQIKNASVADTVAEIKNSDGDKRKKIYLACRQVAKSIRYTGVEFGANKILPHTPAQTLKRRYGDCKDQAALLVAMLRELEIDAQVALLSVQPHVDLVTDAPGLNAFDHAIVYVPPQRNVAEMWIDLTSPFTTFGELPLSDQGRLALVASPDTNDLKRTPLRTSGDNRRSQSYTYHLSADRSTRAVVETSDTGDFATYMRSIHASHSEPEVLAALKQKYEIVYGLTKVNSIKFADPQNTLARNYRITYDFNASRIGTAEDGQLLVELRPGSAFQYLPAELISPASSFVDDDSPPREHPFVVQGKYSYETTYRMIPPPGFKVDVLPESHQIRVADLAADVQYSETENGAVQVAIKVDTGPGVLDIKQVREFREAFLDITGDQSPEGWLIPITFHYQPRRMFDQGDEVKAIGDMVAMTKSHPKSLFNRIELSGALLRVGLGEEAREIAKKLVAEAPGSSRANTLLGWTHMHDLLGGNMKFGMDRATALAGFRKAVQLDPGGINYVYNYAVTLEHDDLGGRYSSEDDLRKAVELYQQLIQSHQMEQALINCGIVLLNLGETRELRQLSAKYPNHDATTAVYATSELSDNGVKAAARIIARAPSQMQPHIYNTVAARIRALRKYDLMREFIRDMPDDSGVTETVRKLDRHEKSLIDPSEPTAVVQTLLSRWLESGQDVASLRDLYVNADQPGVFANDVRLLPAYFRDVREIIVTTFGRRDVARDIISLYKFEAVGDDDAGYIVTAEPHDEKTGAPFLRRFVIRDGESYKIFGQGRFAWQLGELALKLFDDGKPKAAVRWIDEIYDVEKRQVGMFNPFAASPFAQARAITNPDDASGMRIVALLLALSHGNIDSRLQELTELRKSAAPLMQLQIDRVRLHHLQQNRRYQELFDLTDSMSAKYSSFSDVLRARFYAELGLGKLDAAKQSLTKLAVKNKAEAIIARRDLLFATGGHQAVYDYDQKTLEAASDVMLQQAMMWRSLFVGKSAEVIEQADNMLKRSTVVGDDGTLHTLACLYADVGQLQKATAVLNATIRTRNGIRDPVDEVVLGLIAEHCGLKQAAKKYYQRAKTATTEFASDVGTSQLAELRLKKLNLGD